MDGSCASAGSLHPAPCAANRKSGNAKLGLRVSATVEKGCGWPLLR